MLSTTPFEIPADLLEKARGLSPIPMAVAGAGHPLVMESARQAADAGLIEPILVGGARDIGAIAGNMGWDVSQIRIVATDGEDGACRTAAALASGNEVAALMKGHVHSDALMRAVLNREAGLRTGRRASHVFHMTVPGRSRVLFITDAALNVAPDTEAMLDIIQNAVDVAQALGNREPKVALLSASETATDAMPSSIVAAEAARRAQEGAIQGALIDGPLAFDGAVSPEAAKLKGINVPVAGRADILVVPNIEMGNGLVKMMVYFMSGLAAGMVMGARVPIVLTSRADPAEARLAAAAIAAIIAAK
jgi:phosphate acetyltransferase